MSRKPITLIENADYEKIKSHSHKVEAQNAILQEQIRQ